MSRYKILPLPKHFAVEDEEWFWTFNEDYLTCHEKIMPVFNRYGMYYDREEKTGWIETMFGCWRLPFATSFSDELSYVSSEEDLLPPKMVEAIKVIGHYRKLPKVLKDLLYKHECAEMLRDTYRSACKFRLQVINK